MSVSDSTDYRPAGGSPRGPPYVCVHTYENDHASGSQKFRAGPCVSKILGVQTCPSVLLSQKILGTTTSHVTGFGWMVVFKRNRSKFSTSKCGLIRRSSTASRYQEVARTNYARESGYTHRRKNSGNFYALKELGNGNRVRMNKNNHFW